MRSMSNFATIMGIIRVEILVVGLIIGFPVGAWVVERFTYSRDKPLLLKQLEMVENRKPRPACNYS